MKRLFSSADSAKIGLIRSLLDAADIPYEVRNHAVSQVEVGLPFEEELWVAENEYEDAALLVAESHKE
jgi:hypothetical protein